VDIRPAVLQRQRIVEVLGRLWVDRERKLVAEIDPALEGRRRGVVGLEPLPGPGLDQQRLEHVLDPLRGAKHALDTRPATPAGDDGEIARARVARALAVDDDRNSGREVRLADNELAAPGKLYNNGF
jgi:hypothetical protein